jgi:hypothetical protein
MMPQLLTVRIRQPEGRPVRIWIPVLPMLLVLCPLVVLAVLGAAVACLVFRVDLARGLGAGWRLVSALPGTRVDVNQGDTAVLVAIR